MEETVPKKEIIRFLALTYALGLMGTVWTSIPILFYRPTAKCEVEQAGSSSVQNSFQSITCSDFDVCEYMKGTLYQYTEGNNAKKIYLQSNGDKVSIEYYTPYTHLTSISMEFDLFCERKIYEPNILSLGMLGQVIGALLGVVVQISPKNQTIFFLFLQLSTCFVFFYALFANSLLEIAILFFFWNLIQSYYYCTVYSYVNLSFGKKLRDFGSMGIHVVWCIATVLFIIYTMYFGNWRENLGYYLAPQILISSVIFYLCKNEEFEQKANEVLSENSQPNQFQVVTPFTTKIRQILQNKILFRNVLLWGLCYLTAIICYYMCSLILNTLAGDLYINNLGSSNLELLVQVSAGILLANVDKKRAIIVVYSVMGLSYCASVFTIQASDLGNQEISGFQIFIKLIPIIIGKGTHEMLGTLLYGYLQEIISLEHQQIVISGNQLVSYIIAALLPFYKYIMEYMQINYFILIGGLCFLTAKYSMKFESINSNQPLLEPVKGQIEIPLLDMRISCKSNQINLQINQQKNSIQIM